MLRYSLVLTFFLFLMTSSVDAQTDTSAPANTSISKKSKKSKRGKTQKPIKEKGKFKKSWKLPYPNPTRALIYSMVIPGAGQLYNKRYWKAPIVWGAFVGLAISVADNKDGQDRFDKAYRLNLMDLPHEFDAITRNSDALRRQRENFKKNLQLNYLGFIGLYVLQTLDAYVDSHLKSFDISDDLSFTIKPNFTQDRNSSRIQSGIGLYLNF